MVHRRELRLLPLLPCVPARRNKQETKNPQLETPLPPPTCAPSHRNKQETADPQEENTLLF